MKKKKASSSEARSQQLWGSRLREAPDAANVEYCAGRDVAGRPPADEALVPFDVWQNMAHVAMLSSRGVIPAARARAIVKTLAAFEREVAGGLRRLDPRKEDVHTNIEHFVAARLGEAVSGQIHTARSRNDQTTTVVRLYVRDRLAEYGARLAALAKECIRLARKNAAIPMAGLTHYQPGSITTVGHLFAGHAQAMVRDLGRIAATLDRINVCPLGAAASFGTSWPIDRKLTARLLGFQAVQANTLDCITNRWEMEADAAQAVAFSMTHLSMLSQDLVIFSMPQIGILRLPDRYVTGSSIMPQKRNPDFAEVTRSKAAVVQHQMASLFAVARGLPSGYNRDTQWTKYLVMDLFDEALDAPVIFRGVLAGLETGRKAAARSASSDFVDAVDAADGLARVAGLPFRAAYNIISKAVKECDSLGRIDPAVVNRLLVESGRKPVELGLGSPAQIVAAKTHEGAPAPAALKRDLKLLEREALAAASRVARVTRQAADARVRLGDFIKRLT